MPIKMSDPCNLCNLIDEKARSKARSRGPDEATWCNNISSINISDFTDGLADVQDDTNNELIHYLNVECRGK